MICNIIIIYYSKIGMTGRECVIAGEVECELYLPLERINFAML